MYACAIPPTLPITVISNQSQTQKRVEELGGTTLGEKEPEGESGWYIYFKDVAGNRFGAYELKKA